MHGTEAVSLTYNTPLSFPWLISSVVMVRFSFYSSDYHCPYSAHWSTCVLR